MDLEIEKIKKEYEEKQKQKKAKKKAKDDKDKKKDEDEDDSKAEKERDEKVFSSSRASQWLIIFQIKAVQSGTKPDTAVEDGPRIFALQRLSSHRAPRK